MRLRFILIGIFSSMAIGAPKPKLGEALKALPFRQAVTMGCVNSTCDASCQENPLLLLNAQKDCRESAAAVLLECKTLGLSLESFMNQINGLEGETPDGRLLSCAATATENDRDIYLCETFTGAFYAELKIEAIPNPVGTASVFNASVYSDDLKGSGSITGKNANCRVRLDVGLDR